jgi:peptidoglycan/xylan/chitin deacetylase (PgdA/CDA1 family)
MLLGAAPLPHFVEVPAPSVTVLLFHQVSDSPVESANGGEDQVKKPWLSPAAFDAVLTDAERRGYAFVTLASTLAYLRGTPGATLPPKAMLLSFDDGYVNADTGGTPILRKHHATAVMFFEGRLTGTNPARLTLAELQAMRASGVWEIQSHGWAGHSNVVVDAAGTRNPYWYANLAWLPQAGRLETLDEFEARVRNDLTHFRTAFEGPLDESIHVFAYPSGEFGQNAALPPGGDPKTRLEAGHSDAPGLTPKLFAAVRAAGFDAAFAVSIPGDVAPADRSNDLLALPRLGVGADFTIASLDALATTGLPLPEIVDGHFTDPGPIAALPDGFILAASAAPELYRLDLDGRVLATYAIPALLDDRPGKPALISGVAASGGDVIVVQQAGTWPGATPRFTRLHLDAAGAHVLERRALPPAMNWLVGIAPVRGAILGMTDDGALFDVVTGAAYARVALADPAAPRSNRFAGPLTVDGNVAVYDRVERALVVLDAASAPAGSIALGSDLRNFAATQDGFAAVDWADNRHILRRWREVAR